MRGVRRAGNEGLRLGVAVRMKRMKRLMQLSQVRRVFWTAPSPSPIQRDVTRPSRVVGGTCNSWYVSRDAGEAKIYEVQFQASRQSGPAQLQRVSIILRNNAAGSAIDAADLAHFPALAQDVCSRPSTRHTHEVHGV